MLLSYNQINELLDAGVVRNAKRENVNAASLDLTLGAKFLKETKPSRIARVDVMFTPQRVGPEFEEFTNHVILDPGEFCLAQTVETFFLPNNLSAEYKLKSSLARCGLQHMLAGWCDAGWSGSVLTLEFHNALKRHSIALSAGGPAGQIIFFRHEPVPDRASYFTRGRYNNDTQVQEMK